MLFPTATFAIFFLIVLPLSWLAMPTVHRWRPFIIVASYVFYAGGTGASSSCSPAARSGTTCWRFAIHRARVQSQRKALLWFALAGDLGVLGYFKYYDFFVNSSDNMLAVVGLDVAAVAALDRAAGRHLVLHVHGDQLRRRHLPGRHRARRRSRSSPSTSPSSRTWLRGRSSGRRADPADRDAARSRAASTRAGPST